MGVFWQEVGRHSQQLPVWQSLRGPEGLLCRGCRQCRCRGRCRYRGYFGCVEGVPRLWYRRSCGTDFDNSEIDSPDKPGKANMKGYLKHEQTMNHAVHKNKPISKSKHTCATKAVGSIFKHARQMLNHAPKLQDHVCRLLANKRPTNQRLDAYGSLALHLHFWYFQRRVHCKFLNRYPVRAVFPPCTFSTMFSQLNGLQFPVSLPQTADLNLRTK